MTKIQNPILRGFNPDPSIVRVGSNYYIATSTFEWFPGVQIHHSKDLINWQLITHPLDSLELLEMKGVPDSCGVWAPCLSHDGDQFYLVYTNCKSFDGVWKDTPNYLTTTKDITGPWSPPVLLGSYGFDGSLFHDEDGRKWFLSLSVDHRKGLFFGGIILQEYDQNEKTLIGPIYHIFKGTDLGITEGPHLYKRDGYYYLMIAEGGTEYEHAVSLARSQKIEGPYEVHPSNPLISATESPSYPLQKTGHADFVFTEEGRCYIVFLVGRPLTPLGRCTLGRETAMEELVWKEGWPYLASGGRLPRIEIDMPVESQHEYNNDEVIDFALEELSIHYASLRVPRSEDWIRRDLEKGQLILRGRESLSSTHNQSLIARRVQHFNISYSAIIDFEPNYFQQMMGLVFYYNTGHYYYLNIYGDEDQTTRWLNVVKSDNFDYSECLSQPIKLEDGLVHLAIRIQGENIRFSYSIDDQKLIDLGIFEDASIISDDYVRDGSDRYRPAFTGSFVGIACQDLTGKGHAGAICLIHYKED